MKVTETITKLPPSKISNTVAIKPPISARQNETAAYKPEQYTRPSSGSNSNHKEILRQNTILPIASNKSNENLCKKIQRPNSSIGINHAHKKRDSSPFKPLGTSQENLVNKNVPFNPLSKSFKKHLNNKNSIKNRPSSAQSVFKNDDDFKMPSDQPKINENSNSVMFFSYSRLIEIETNLQNEQNEEIIERPKTAFAKLSTSTIKFDLPVNDEILPKTNKVNVDEPKILGDQDSYNNLILEKKEK